LAERESLSGATHGADLINGLKNRQEVEINPAQIEHWRGSILATGLLIQAGGPLRRVQRAR
jgi:hypothetical protein